MNQVLLVPKKKSDGPGADQHRVLVMSQASAQVSTGSQQQQMTWNGQQQSTLALALSTQSGGVQQQRVVSQQVRSKSSGLQSTVRFAPSTGVVAVTTRFLLFCTISIVSTIFYKGAPKEFHFCSKLLVLLPRLISLL